ncbi:hypothetical protein [Phenylobacterium sp.]|jgi:hypothetical protein|uniref:ribbon-helix-helix protein n=1 Tax=Phenylobacterium sp. TaxID=1871053 RepID=UPI00273070D5|nr:hypothetical protein [Phenylobacterium sp.]MDP1600268.1 hypothetical protein [Phenylobacterium sp.]MDP3593664.1 hypothetical protein [Phenylobacterium sp.]
MSERFAKRGFASRPGDPESWIKAPDRQAQRAQPADDFSARLTIDVTADMRGRIKIAAFQRGQTVADMLRALFEREFPPSQGDAQ